MPEGNGWSKYQMLVLDKLDTLEESVECVEKKVGNLRVEMAQLKVKTGIFGAIAGFLGATVPVIVALVFYLMKG